MTDKEIRSEYGKLLKKQGIHYNDHQSFDISIPLKNVKSSFTQVCGIHDGKILLDDYIASCIYKFKTAEKVAETAEEAYPDYHFVAEHYSSGYEISVSKYVQFTTIEDLHQEVLAMAEVVDGACGIAKKILGDCFDR